MIRYYFVLAIGFLFSSCATLILKKTVEINVHSNTDSVKICVNNDTTRWYNTPNWIHVERSKNDLLITAKKDTIQKQILVNSKLSAAFWLGNMFSGLGIVGYAIDLTSPKKFNYPSYVTIDFNSDQYPNKKYRKWLAPEKHLLNFKISVPEGNNLYLDKSNGYGNSLGFLGISGGFEYYITDKHCLTMDIGTLTNFLMPLPAPFDYHVTNQSSSAIYADIQLGSDYKRWHYDLGFQFTRTFQYEREAEYYFDTLKYAKKQNNTGFAFSTYYRISRAFNLGINYYPSFIIWDNSRIQTHYSHLIFFELSYRIEGYRPKKTKK